MPWCTREGSSACSYYIAGNPDQYDDCAEECGVEDHCIVPAQKPSAQTTPKAMPSEIVLIHFLLM